MTKAEVQELFAPLNVQKVEKLSSGESYVVYVSSGCRAVGKFAFENNLLDRIGGSGSYNESCSFYFDQAPWNGQFPKSWLPKAAQQDTRAPALVKLKAALPCKSQWLNDTQLKVLEIPFNLSFVLRNNKLYARFLMSGKTFKNSYDDHELVQSQAVELVRRSRHLLTGL